jgi:hypothetical protein
MPNEISFSATGAGCIVGGAILTCFNPNPAANIIGWLMIIGGILFG